LAAPRLLPQLAEPGWARYAPGAVLRLFIGNLSQAALGVKGTRWLATEAATTAHAILRTLPGAVRIEADPALGEGFEARERARFVDTRRRTNASAASLCRCPSARTRPARPGFTIAAILATCPT
jgi:hypothetical protein